MLSFRNQQAQILLVLLTILSVLGVPKVQARDSPNNQTIQLDKPAYFTTLEGDSAQLKPGNYELASLPDNLQVTPLGGISSVQLAITLNTHNQKLSEPIAVSVEGKSEGESADRHILALYLPGGFSYIAEGTYSGIQTRAVNPQAVIEDPKQIYLEKPVHFFTPDGKDHLAKPGRYTVEQADQHIRLVPGEPKEALLVEAQAETHDSGLAIPIALSLPGTAEEEADLHHVVLLLPGGKSLEAIGTYSGIQSRGIIRDIGKGVKKATKPVRKTVNRAKNTVTKVGQQVTKSPPNFQTLQGTGRVLGNAATNTAQDAAKFTEKAALEAKRKAEWVAQQAAKGVQWLGQQGCKLALKTAETGIQVAGKTLSPALTQVQKMLNRQNMKRKLEGAIDQAKRQLGPTIYKAIEAASIMTDPRNAIVLKRLLKKETICDTSPAEVQKTLLDMFKKPIKEVVTLYQDGNNSKVRSRGAKDFSVAFGLGGGGGFGGGIDVGARYTTSRFGHTSPPDQWFLDGNLSLATRAGGEGGIIIGFFPNIRPEDTGKEFFAISVGGGLPAGSIPESPKGVGTSVDFIFGPFSDAFTFQGFAISFTAGASPKSANDYAGAALKVGYGLGL